MAPGTGTAAIEAVPLPGNSVGRARGQRFESRPCAFVALVVNIGWPLLLTVFG